MRRLLSRLFGRVFRDPLAAPAATPSTLRQARSHRPPGCSQNRYSGPVGRTRSRRPAAVPGAKTGEPPGARFLSHTSRSTNPEPPQRRVPKSATESERRAGVDPGTTQPMPAKVLEEEFYRHFGLKACSPTVDREEVAALLRMPPHLSYLVPKMSLRELTLALALSPPRQHPDSGLANHFGVAPEVMASWLEDSGLVEVPNSEPAERGAPVAGESEWDLHILYASDDKARAVHLHRALEAKGLKPWTAEISTNHGDRFVTEISQQLRQAKVVAILLGAKLGGIQRKEIELLEVRPSEQVPRLIPIVLPERGRSEPLPAFLQSRQIANWDQEERLEFEGIAKAVRRGAIR